MFGAHPNCDGQLSAMTQGGLITRKALHMPDTPMKSNQGEQCCQHPSENANNVVLALGKAEQNHHLS